VIPTYNYGRFGADGVASVRAQTYRDFEVIVVDDGSKDDTRERLAPFMDQIRYIYQANQGLSAARNTGIREARGTWVALLDSDDIWHPRKLEMQFRCLAAHPQVALLGTCTVPDFRAGWPEVDPKADLSPQAVTLAEIVFTTRFAPSTVLMRKQCFDEVGLFDKELRSAEDRDMWIRVARHFPVARLNLPLCWYRVHDSNMSNVAVRMEVNELRMLRKTFADDAALRRHLLLRMKTYSYAYYNSTMLYSASRQWGTALDRFVRSFVCWPLPYRRKEVACPLARLRMLAVLLLRMLHVRPPAPAPQTSP